MAEVKDKNGKEDVIKIEEQADLEKNEPVSPETTTEPVINFTYQKAEEYFTGSGSGSCGSNGGGNNGTGLVGGGSSGGGGGVTLSSKKTLITIKYGIES